MATGSLNSFTPLNEIMVVWIRSIQKRTALNLPVILSNCNNLVEILRIGHFDVNLMFVGKGYIKSLNLRYRRRNVVTDILAFPNFEVSGKKFITFSNCKFHFFSASPPPPPHISPHPTEGIVLPVGQEPTPF